MIVAALMTAVALAGGAVERFVDATVPARSSGTVLAARDGRIVHCGGFGRAGSCDTAYDVMSITKQFTATAILKLEVMGRLRVSDRIDRFVGPVPDDKRAITIHQLLTHTSGLVEGLGDDYEPVSREQLLDGVLHSRLHAAPGAEYGYSNVGYSVLAAIVEKASGMGYEQFVARHLFRPAGMRRTGYVLPRWRRVAVEYDARGRSQGRPFDHPWAADEPFWNLRGNGGMLSTARDMFRWSRALDGDQVLDRRAKRKLFAPHVREGPDSHYGYGWVVARGGRLVWHDGGNGWSLAVFARFADGVTVFWVSNRAYRAGRWNLERRAERLTLGIAGRTRR